MNFIASISATTTATAESSRINQKLVPIYSNNIEITHKARLVVDIETIVD